MCLFLNLYLKLPRHLLHISKINPSYRATMTWSVCNNEGQRYSNANMAVCTTSQFKLFWSSPSACSRPSVSSVKSTNPIKFQRLSCPKCSQFINTKEYPNPALKTEFKNVLRIHDIFFCWTNIYLNTYIST